MKDSSKVIMGATLVMIVGIAILLGLIIILLAELYCSMLLRRRRRNSKSSLTSTFPISMAPTAIGTTNSEQKRSVTPSLSDFYAQGVLNAPRNLLFPSLHHGNAAVDLEKQHSVRLYDKVFDSPIQEIRSSPDYRTRATAFSLESSPSFVKLAPPKLVYEVPHHQCTSGTYDDDQQDCGGSSKETYIYICNPIYDNNSNRFSSRRLDTPFETPDSSPSRLETNGNSSIGGEEEEEEKHVVQSSPITTPPLTPMKKLPAEGISISLRDPRSLPTSGSESNSNNEVISSILSSGSPCTTSPSW
ncbi:OLC1v1037285C1 [Oldenlandia corymbosa var. corymbosa]|uniref:OLC1v1037285C1 n=1 Tax=Oldenlandia corymbosa var. corymbosa TaxID=529605 RepID=A0AAV1CXY8_OLDCO|nr:OLC1v1037285C1 [Oldenlandia corymbosa var. corymbosa]